MIPEKHLHIVCLDVPYPVDCKSAFIMFNELKALHQQGIKISLHCFVYTRPAHEFLNHFCESVYYYPKQRGHKGYSVSLPYIVSSRSAQELIGNLSHDDYPILVHGIHSTYFLTQLASPGRKIIVRLHYAEHAFYSNLVKLDGSLLRKLYYYNESRLLKCYEKFISSKAIFAALSEETRRNYKEVLGCKQIIRIPAIVPWTEIMSKEGSGNFCLFHGNLSMPENEKAAMWLLNNVFNKLNIPFVIAGKSPSSSLEKESLLRANTCLVANPSQHEMQDLISKAHINVLPSFHGNSCNIKLVNALFCGRHCIVNEDAAEPELKPFLHTARDARSFRQLIQKLMREPFEIYDIRNRKGLPEKHYNNDLTVSRLMRLIW